MYVRKSVTLLELMVVLSVLAVLLSFAVPTYFKAQRRARDRIARSQLELIQEAEKMQRLEVGSYIACTDNLSCQTALDIDLPQGTRDWVYSVPAGTVDNTSIPPTFCAQATGGGGSSDWHIDQDDDEAQVNVCP